MANSTLNKLDHGFGHQSKRHAPPPMLIEIKHRICEEWLRITKTNQKPCIFVPRIDVATVPHLTAALQHADAITDGGENGASGAGGGKSYSAPPPHSANASPSSVALQQQLQLFPASVRKALSTIGLHSAQQNIPNQECATAVDLAVSVARKSNTTSRKSMHPQQPTSAPYSPPKCLNDDELSIDPTTSDFRQLHDQPPKDPLESFYVTLASRQIDFDTQVRNAAARLEIPQKSVSAGTQPQSSNSSGELYHCCFQHVMLGYRCMGLQTGKGHCCYQRLLFDQCCRGRYSNSDPGHGWPRPSKTGDPAMPATTFNKRLPCAECSQRVFRFPRIRTAQNQDLETLFHEYKKYKHLARNQARTKEQTSLRLSGGDHRKATIADNLDQNAKPNTVAHDEAEQPKSVKIRKIMHYRRSIESGNLVHGGIFGRPRPVAMRRFAHHGNRRAFMRFNESTKAGQTFSGNRHSLSVEATSEAYPQCGEGDRANHLTDGEELQQEVVDVASKDCEHLVQQEIRQFLRFIRRRSEFHHKNQFGKLKRLSGSNQEENTAIGGNVTTVSGQQQDSSTNKPGTAVPQKVLGHGPETTRLSNQARQQQPPEAPTPSPQQPAQQQQITNLTSMAEFDTLMQEFNSSSTYIFVELHASWCPASRLIARNIQRCLARRTNVDCIRVDIDQIPEALERFDVHALPFYMVFHEGKLKRHGLMSTYKEIQKILQLIENGDRHSRKDGKKLGMLPEFLWRRQFLLDYDNAMSAANSSLSAADSGSPTSGDSSTASSPHQARQSSYAHLVHAHGSYLPNPYQQKATMLQQHQQQQQVPPGSTAASTAKPATTTIPARSNTNRLAAPTTKGLSSSTTAALSDGEAAATTSSIFPPTSAPVAAAPPMSIAEETIAIRYKKRFGHHYGRSEESTTNAVH